MTLEPLWANGSQLSPALRYTLTGHASAVTTIAHTMTPDGRLIAVTGGWDDGLRVWDVLTGRAATAPLEGHTDVIKAIACVVTGDDRLIAVSTGHDRTVRVWDVFAGRCLWTHPLWGVGRAVAIGGDRKVVVGVEAEVVVFEMVWEEGAVAW